MTSNGASRHRGLPGRAGWLRTSVIALLACIASAAGAQTQLREPEIEAAYLVNFLRYTQWPEQRFASAQSPFVMTVVGSEEEAASVRAVAKAAGLIDGRPIEVRHVAPARDAEAGQDKQDAEVLRSSHLVFLHESAGKLREQVLARLVGQPVLTVSDLPGFTAGGGMLGLVNSAGRIVFEANPVAIRDAGLLVSAKVLKLARAPGSAPP